MRQPLTTFLVVFVTALACRALWNAFTAGPLLSHEDVRQTIMLTVALGLVLTAIDRRQRA